MKAFTGASLVAMVLSASFGAMLLSLVLWEQNVWGWSALRTGLSVAPGPLMVPLFGFLVTGRLIARWGAGVTIALGSLAFAAGTAWWALDVGLEPDYGEILGGMVLTGIGVGLFLPTFMAAAASSLPPASFATGSAVVNMLRQVGLAIGVAVLIAVLGAGVATDPVPAYQRALGVIAAASLVAAVAGLLSLRPSRPATGPAVGAAVPERG